jgi:DNA-binding transcriptional ArsR family regulator
VDEVFKALADPSRRHLLDRLRKRDGQTLSELCSELDMTRFGAMKHLRVLEGARLITTQKVGREKLHFLNPVPIQLIYDRWVSNYAKPIARGLTKLKRDLEEEEDSRGKHASGS